MSLTIHLLGRPRMQWPAGEGYQFRSRKSWALLAYLTLDERPPTRSQLAGLLSTTPRTPSGRCVGACRRYDAAWATLGRSTVTR